MMHLFARVEMTRVALASAVMLALANAGPIAATAAQSLPSYASSDEQIRGRIVSLDSNNQLKLRDERGFIDNVRLHDGTVINPTGLRLAAGQSVTIHGHTDGTHFSANEIDTPYASYSGPPANAYRAYAYPAYGYPAYGYPAYGYYAAPYYGVYGYPYRVYRPGFGIGFRTRGFGFRGVF